jgi:hypothetical protein
MEKRRPENLKEGQKVDPCAERRYETTTKETGFCFRHRFSGSYALAK